MSRTVAEDEGAAMYAQHVGPRLRGLSSRRSKASACLYTVTPDADFLVERHPGRDRLVVLSACSGHGFKHSAAVGEAAAQLVLGEAPGVNLSIFSSGRLKPKGPAARAEEV